MKLMRAAVLSAARFSLEYFYDAAAADKFFAFPYNKKAGQIYLIYNLCL